MHILTAAILPSKKAAVRLLGGEPAVALEQVGLQPGAVNRIIASTMRGERDLHKLCREALRGIVLPL
jgi:hypothetical protein